MSIRAWKITLLVLAAALAAAFLAWWLTNPRISDQQQIENLVAKVEHGVETKSGQEIMQCVAPDYKGSVGNDRLEILKWVNAWVRSADQADVTIQQYEIKAEGPTATGHFQVEVNIQAGGRFQPSISADLDVTFEKQWRRLRRVWLVKEVKGPSFRGLEEYL